MPQRSDNATLEGLAQARSAIQRAFDDMGSGDTSASSDNDWSLPPDEQRFLARLVVHLQPQHILEFGSGESTALFTDVCARLEAPCHITSIEHDPDFQTSTIQKLANHAHADRVTVQLAPVVLRECGGKLLPTYRLDAGGFASNLPIDLALIDGPPAALGGREGTLYQVLNFARTGTVIVLDDANREVERAVVSRWQENLGEAIEVTLWPEFSHGLATILIRERVPSNELWDHRLRLCRQDLNRALPSENVLILVDQNHTDGRVSDRAIPFLERDGQYFGPPADDSAAICELERLREAHAAFIAFVWPAFWWLDYYPEFRHHLRSHYRCILENERLILFDLRS